MLQFKCLGTGSSGNCYLLTNEGGKTIILDAGVSIDKIIKNVNLNNVEFAFISHSHGDHSKSLKKLLDYKVKVIEATPGANVYRINKTTIRTFEVTHGDTLCNGCIIEQGSECVLYLTDLTLCKWALNRFSFTKAIIECNYLKKLANGQKIGFSRELENIQRHLDLEGTKEILNKLNLVKCKEIILVHFSDSFSNPVEMAIDIHQTYNIKTLACKKRGGFEIYE